jgi:2-amino-4-hydroxy-6-hydroxymethyldihydropteridine diphosphokinase
MGCYALIGRMGGKGTIVTAFLGLGANLGDRLATLQGARHALASHAQVTIAASSPLYETEPVGGPAEQDPYFNAVLQIATDLPPVLLLAYCRSIEEAFGRQREARWGPRTLDIDLLLYGSLQHDEGDLQLPHPRLHLRRFVLAPLADLAPHLPHPRLGRCIAELLTALPSKEAVSLVCQQW